MIKNHFTATGIVFNARREILMIRHNKLKVWLPPGGHIQDNELPDDAVLREIFEETGVMAEIVPNRKKLDLADSHCLELEVPFVILLEDIEGDGTHNHIDMVYICRAVTEDLILQEGEVHGIGWFSYDQAMKLKTFENVTKTITHAVDFYKSIVE